MNSTQQNDDDYINDKFRYTKYLDFCVIEDIETGYINATKLCTLAGKRFKNWLSKKHAKNIITKTENIYNCKVIKLVIGGANKELFGSYVHLDLIPDIIYWCKTNKNKINDGFIYILYNPMFNFYGEHIYKIGCTYDLNSRLKSYITSYIEESSFVYTKQTKDYENVEQQIHLLLHEFRISHKREFFNCPLDQIVRVIDECIK